MERGSRSGPCCAGRVEFTAFFPENTQGVLVQPIGSEGILIAGSDTQRGFSRLDQVSWAIAEIVMQCDPQYCRSPFSGKVRVHSCTCKRWNQPDTTSLPIAGMGCHHNRQAGQHTIRYQAGGEPSGQQTA